MEKRIKKIVIILLLAIPCKSEVIIVKADGSGDYPTIQAAINNAITGDIIELQPGTYTGDGNRDIDPNGKAITIRSVNPNDPCVVAGTIIDCNGTEVDPHRGFYFHNNEDVNSVLDGLTITNGNVHWEGGAIHCTYASPTIMNCIITGNSTGTAGGGIYCWNSNLTIKDCTIAGNRSEEDGGGIFCWESSPTIIRSRIVNNSSEQISGGGIFFADCNAAIFSCDVIQNSAESAGGIGCFGGNVTIANCFISNNSAEWDYAGGIYCMFGTVTISNCTITHNSARVLGGGIYCRYVNLTSRNCTIVNNSAGESGGGICSLDESSLNITNCIIWDNSPDQITYDNYTPLITYSDVQASWPGLGNIDSEPCFVDATNSDYHLLPVSPCINAGDPNYILDPNCPNDLDGNPRIIDGRIDMGAYEFPGMLGAKLFCVPRVLNTQSRRRTIVALLAMPQGILRSDINQSELLVFTPGNVIAQRQYVFQWKKRGRLCTRVMAVFNKSDCMPHLSPGQNQVEVTGKLNDGRYFSGQCNLRVNSPTPTRNRRHRYK